MTRFSVDVHFFFSILPSYNPDTNPSVRTRYRILIDTVLGGITLEIIIIGGVAFLAVLTVRSYLAREGML